MAKDIRFYSLGLDLLYVLPSFSLETGYISFNATRNFRGAGSVEIVFLDDELKDIVEENKDGIVVEFNGFQGYITSFKWDKQCRLTGVSLSGLLHRAVVSKTVAELNDNVENIAMAAIHKEMAWLKKGALKGFGKQVYYSTSKYELADTYIENLLSLDNAGYKITADFDTKEYTFECIKPKNIDLILSENNLNAYDFDTSYINKEKAMGGWYEQEDDGEKVWNYITTDSSLNGVERMDCVLTKNTHTEAMNELLSKVAKYKISTKTRNIEFGVDYNLGDIVRVQIGDKTAYKIVDGVDIWQEKGYGEQPILKDWEV